MASVTERERLMGFPTIYTAALFKKPPKDAAEQKAQDVARAAIDLWLWSMTVRTDPKPQRRQPL